MMAQSVIKWDDRITRSENLLYSISRRYDTPTTNWIIGFYLSAWGLIVQTSSGWGLTITNAQILVNGGWHGISVQGIDTVPTGRIITFNAPTDVTLVDGNAYLISATFTAN